jgi:Asp/Glu/hydantoin racemase
MKILLINPNTTATITDLVLAHARPLAPDGVTLAAATGAFGPRYIASRAAAAIAGHAALDCYARHGAGCDAVLLACFGDPGLDGLRELADVPVVGMAEASCAAAAPAGRFAIVTGGERWGPMLTEFAAARGYADRLVEVRTVAPTGADIARDPDGSLQVLAEACRSAAVSGAATVVLGGAGLAGLAARLRGAVPVPVMCSLEAGMAAVLDAARSRTAKPQSGDFARTPPVPTISLSEPLAALMEGQRRTGPEWAEDR